MSGDVDRLQSLGMALANISIRMKISVKKIEESLETIIKVMNLERDRDEARAEVERTAIECNLDGGDE